jgi:hypothetical protein
MRFKDALPYGIALSIPEGAEAPTILLFITIFGVVDEE